MTRFEKCELLKKKGYKYDPKTGKVYGVRGKEIKHTDGKYLYVRMPDHSNLAQHHFAWYMIYGNVDFVELDHENRDKKDNRISNLRILTRSEQQHNREAKGYYFYKRIGRYMSRIQVNYQTIFLGYYDTEEEAKQAYLQAKQKYHPSFN
jgi:hypothetical protein